MNPGRLLAADHPVFMAASSLTLPRYRQPSSTLINTSPITTCRCPRRSLQEVASCHLGSTDPPDHAHPISVSISHRIITGWTALARVRSRREAGCRSSTQNKGVFNPRTLGSPTDRTPIAILSIPTSVTRAPFSMRRIRRCRPQLTT
jgi:hypothetical protein